MSNPEMPEKMEIIAETLRDEILGGRLAVGQRLTETELSERFGASRATIRPVIQQLTMRGLLVFNRNCGAAVAPETTKVVRDLIVPIRRTIETSALRLIYADLTTTHFDAWEAVLAKMKSACERQDLHAIAESDLAFHRTILEHAGQPDLLAIWEILVGRVRSEFRRTQRQIARLMDIYDEHQELLAAFRNADEEFAVRLLKAKIT